MARVSSWWIVNRIERSKAKSNECEPPRMLYWRCTSNLQSLWTETDLLEKRWRRSYFMMIHLWLHNSLVVQKICSCQRDLSSRRYEFIHELCYRIRRVFVPEKSLTVQDIKTRNIFLQLGVQQQKLFVNKTPCRVLHKNFCTKVPTTPSLLLFHYKFIMKMNHFR